MKARRRLVLAQSKFRNRIAYLALIARCEITAFSINWRIASHPERHMTFTNGRYVTVPADMLDHVISWLASGIRDFKRAWRESSCQHPRSHYREVDDGDEDFGPFIQHKCYLCDGNINPSDIDRY